MSKSRQRPFKRDDLKNNLKECIFPGSTNYPIVVCENAGTFTRVMSVFQNYEQIVVSVIVLHADACAYVVMHKLGFR